MSKYGFNGGVVTSIPSGIYPVRADRAIVGGVTRAMVDFSNAEDCYPSQGAFVSLTTFKDLVDGTKTGSTWGTTWPAPYRGLVRTLGVAGGAGFYMPQNFYLESTVDEFLAIMWLRIPKTGWPALAATYHFLPVPQYSFSIFVDATGVVQELRFNTVNQSGTSIIASVGAGSILDSLLDTVIQVGGHHTYAAGVGTSKLYAGVLGTAATLRATSAAGSITALRSTPANSSTASGLFQTDASKSTLDCRFGRASVHVAAIGSDLDVLDFLARDAIGASGFILA